MTVHEMKRFLVKCDKPEGCESMAAVDTLTGVGEPHERQILTVLHGLRWRVRAANTDKPVFLCPKHFEDK